MTALPQNCGGAGPVYGRDTDREGREDSAHRSHRRHHDLGIHADVPKGRALANEEHLVILRQGVEGVECVAEEVPRCTA